MKSRPHRRWPRLVRQLVIGLALIRSAIGIGRGASVEAQPTRRKS